MAYITGAADSLGRLNDGNNNKVKNNANSSIRIEYLKQVDLLSMIRYTPLGISKSIDHLGTLDLRFVGSCY